MPIDLGGSAFASSHSSSQGGCAVLADSSTCSREHESLNGWLRVQPERAPYLNGRHNLLI
jgi:hypothetical protein